MNDTTFRKNFIWNMIGTTLNSFNSMFFMIIITRINGTEDAGIYTLLFSVACLLYNIGIYSGRTFQVTDKTGKYSETEYVIHRMVTVSIMFIVGALYCALKNFDAYRFALTMLLTIMKCLEAFSECLYGVMQKNDELYKSGFSLTIKALGSLMAIIIVNLLLKNLVISFVIVDVICLIVTLVYDFPSIKKYLNKNYSFKHSMTLFKVGFYAFAFYFLNVYLSNAAKYALDGKVTSSEQALFSIVLMPATLINLCAIYLLQPYINRLGLLYLENRVEEFRKSMKMIVLGSVGIGVVALIGATLLGVPVLNLVYGVDLTNYLRSLQIIIVGATLIAIVTILSTALTTFRNTRIQFIIYLIVSGVILLISGIMVDTFGVNGGAYLYLVSTIMQFIFYALAYHREMNKWINQTKESLS
jgi:O-antigen/teichoic acid export membrane protein